MKDKPLVLAEQICKEIQKAGDIFLMQEFLLQLMEDPENLYYDEDEPDYDEMEDDILDYIKECARKAALNLGYPIDAPFKRSNETSVGMEPKQKAVHLSHCGETCKYGDPDCPAVKLNSGKGDKSVAPVSGTPYERFYIKPEPTEVPMDQLIQLVRIVWDGDLISKGDRDILAEEGYACRCEGFNAITPKGIQYLISRGRLRP